MTARERTAASPWRMPWSAWRAIAVRTWREASDDNIGLIAAGVAFYGFLALVPLLSATVLAYGIVAEPETVIRHMRALMEVMPRDVALSVGEMLMTVVTGSDGAKGLGIAVAIAIALFGARNGAGAIVSALNIAYDEKEKRGFVRLNLVALTITACAALAAVVAALAVAALGAIGELLARANDALVILGTLLTYVLLTLGGAAGAAALYRFAPSHDGGRWVWISPGSLLAALLWLALTLGFGAYVAHVARYDSYGSLGAVVALLSWLYLSSYVLLFGAELNSEVEHQSALAAGVPPPEPLSEPRAPAADQAAPAPAPVVPASPDRPSFVAARVAARAARTTGLPKVGWLTSGMATLGLALLRRRGRTPAGLALVAAATGIAVLRGRE